MKTLEDLVKWIIANRRGAAFKGYSEELIKSELILCSTEHSMLYSTNAKDNINGIVCCRANEEKKILYVYDILTTEKGVVKRFMQQCLQMFPSYELRGKVHDTRERSFKDQTKLERRL